MLGNPIELLVADHQNKVDVGLAIARQWYDERGVRAIFDITNSGVALAIQDLAKARDRIVIFKLGLIFGSHRQSLLAARHPVERRQLVEHGRLDTTPHPPGAQQLLLHHRRLRFWRFARNQCAGSNRGRRRNSRGRRTLAPKYRRFQLLSDRRAGLRRQGRGVRAWPAPTSPTPLKQANEYKLSPGAISGDADHLSQRRSTRSASTSPTASPSCSPGIGTSNDDTRAFAKRFYANRGRMPNDNQVALYSSVRHYLEAVAKAGTDDTGAVMKAMREAPIHDIFTANGTIRADGRVLYDRYLTRVKTPAESKYPWDYLTVLAEIPAAEAFRLAGPAGGCTLTGP